MRERKYRAFVKQCNKMIYSENSYPKGNSDYRFVASEDHKKGLGVEYFTSRTEYVSQYGSVILLPDWGVFTDEEAPVTEYTGLKDKNGREIYEGDVYHQGDTNILYVVEYKGASFVGKQIRSSSYAGLEHWKDRIEVIGNIYQNPDLLLEATK